MRGVWLAAAVLLLWIPSAQGQASVSIDESKIRAALKDDSTVISIPIASFADHSIKAELSLAWLRTNEEESSAIHQGVTIRPGQSSIEVPLPLVGASIWTRLRYALAPDRTEARAFGHIGGVVSLSVIASHVFEVKAGYAGVPRRGSQITVHAEAVHPETRVPVAGVGWTATLSIDDLEIAPSYTATHDEGFVDFTFDLPAAKTDTPDDEASVEILGRRGDFEQDAEFKMHVPSHLSGRFQSDKPIYQPGQTIHLRAVILDAQHRAAPGVKLVLRIDDQEGERVHTASLVSSKFGIVQDEWPIPPMQGSGTYQITLTAGGDDEYQVARHMVRVSRYELPTFSVTVKPDRTAYLPGEQPQVAITGAYLFGKPVPKGRVKIVRGGNRWNPETRRSESDDETVAEGEAGEDGIFTAQLDLSADHANLHGNGNRRFQDIQFAAYYKDVISGRTEQRKFDIRISREPIHVYFIPGNDYGSLVYVSTSYADGRPAPTAVEIRFGGRTASLRTNRYGIGKALFANRQRETDALEIKATDAAGLTGSWREQYWPEGTAQLRLETSRTIHRAGEAVTLQITSPPEGAPNQLVLVHAISGDQKVASRVARISNHKGEITFPYQSQFRRTVVFVAWNAVDPPRVYGHEVLGSRAVIFPDGSDLSVSATTERSTYKPGEKASLSMRVAAADGKPVEAALGLAVVDQAVLERARTDSDFGRRPWFACAFCSDGEAEIGGVRLNDLYALKPGSAVSPELDLVAEALVAGAVGFLRSGTSESLGNTPNFAMIAAQIQRLTVDLDSHYLDSVEFPQDLQALSRIRSWASPGLRDPWGVPYSAEFSVERANSVIRLKSAGPDKQFGTADDFVAGTFERAYFTPIRHLIDQALRRQKDYPATEAEFIRILSENGLLLSSLNDPWGIPYRVRITTSGPTRYIQILSAGPDRTFESGDDVFVADFSGAYFQRETAEMAKALHSAVRLPQTVDEFRKAMADAGIDVSNYRDDWNRPYRLVSAISSRYSDRINVKTVRVFGGGETSRTDILPVTQKFITFSLRSAGPDGVEDSYDDFDVAHFPALLQAESAKTATTTVAQPVALLRGTGAISGVVMDPSGAVIPSATVILVDAAEKSYQSAADAEGVFIFASVPAGVYTLRAASPGFASYEVSGVPVTSGKTTRVDVDLQLGSVADAVTVEGGAGIMQMVSASVAEVAPATTPRVREYFPETLIWIPEVITDSNGTSRTQIALADSVTTWKIAVIASTLDGRIAEAESSFRTFQPFFLDFNPPPILTAGDQVELPVTIRNYQDRAQKVDISMLANDWSTLKGPAGRQVTVSPNSSLNVAYVVHATGAQEKAMQRITAIGSHARDAIEKSSRVHPDGQEVVQNVGDLVVGSTSFAVTIPQAAIRGSARGELRLYPNLASLLLESAAAILVTPHGCAEQTISAGYANLIAWRFAHAAGVTDAQIEKRALGNVWLAIDSLSAFRKSDGSVAYWPTGNPDIAVTAYALSFLAEASTVLPVSQEGMRSLVSWLESRQAKDGRWFQGRSNPDLEDRQGLLLTSMVTRALAGAQKAGVKVEGTAIAGGYHHLARFTDRLDEPYMLANFILAAMDAGDESLLGDAVPRLLKLGREERGGLYWDLQTNSPFYGWGTAGRYETTGLVVSALSAWRSKHPASTEIDPQLRRGLVFLLRGRDRMGSWLSTQSTLRAMRAIVDSSAVLGNFGGGGGSIEVRSNGRLVKVMNTPKDPAATDPILLDMSAFLSAGENQISLNASKGTQSSLIRFASTHWLPWEQTQARSSPELRLAVEFDQLDVGAGVPVRCSVKAERVGFHGYGMMLAEIGLPPGAEVDRASLESVTDNGEIDRYEILPDRVVLYLWPAAGGSSFDFYVSARIPMTAKSAASVLYDYYNPEALTEVVPSRWTVK